MEWLVILALGVWTWLQSRRIDTLSRRLDEAETQLSALTAAAPAPASASAPAETGAPAAREEEPEPLLLTEVIADEPPPLVLDTPVPEAANEDVLVLTERIDISAAKPARQFERWLAENGLAWLAGGALALGAIFLVGFMREQNWFTPPVQLGAAAALGLALIGASEWARRRSIAQPPGHPLVAALLAGAGAVAFYAAVWAAHGVHGVVGLGPAAVLLALCAALTIGLSLLHGQALGVLAIGTALLAPALTHAPDWNALGLTLYLCAVGAAGFALAAFKRWAWAAAATLAGLYFWFFAAVEGDQVRVALALLSTASLGAAALALRPALADEPPSRLGWARARALGPSIAIAVSSTIAIFVWLAAAPAPSGLIVGPALIGVFHVALAGQAVRMRAAAAAALVIAIAALALGFIAYLRARFYFGPLGADFYPTLLFAAFTVAVSAVAAHPHRRDRVLIAAAGAIGAGVLTVLAAFSRSEWHSLAAWAPLLAGAGLLFAAAWRTADRARDPRADQAVDLWSGAAAALLLLAVESAFPAAERTVGGAAAALLFTAGFIWRGWRALRIAAPAAAAIAIAHALTPDLFAATLAGARPLWLSLLVIAAAAAVLFAAAFVAHRGGGDARKLLPESLSSAAVLALLIGAFLSLHWIAAGGAGAPLDPLTEAALGALALIAAGHVLMPRPGQALGLISAWRAHVLMGAGLLYALLGPGLGANPWWGERPAAVIGPPLLDSLALAFALPAALSFAAANRLYDRDRSMARIYAGAGGALALIWLVLLVRRAFHGAAMASAPAGLFESAGYAIVLLGFALAIAAVARRRAARHTDGPFTADLSRIMRASAWTAIVSAALILFVLRHPIWGWQDPTTTNALSTLLAVLAQPVAMALALLLGRTLSASPQTEPTRFAAASLGALAAWSFGHSAIRWMHHRGYMDDAAPLAGLEGFGHALWPLAFVLAAAEATRLTPGRDLRRAYLNDLAAIWSAAIWPALAFAALGLWLAYNPWWGAAPARLEMGLSPAFALAGFMATAAMSAAAPLTPFLRRRELFEQAAIAACAGHLLAAATLTVRWLYHGAAMQTAPTSDVEMWTYSAVWALFGAGAFALGMRRADALLRWIGLGLLVLTTAYVFFLTLTRLNGVAQFGSMLGLGAVLAAVTWLARTRRPAGAGEALFDAFTPSARRERRGVRR